MDFIRTQKSKTNRPIVQMDVNSPQFAQRADPPVPSRDPRDFGDMGLKCSDPSKKGCVNPYLHDEYLREKFREECRESPWWCEIKWKDYIDDHEEIQNELAFWEAVDSTLWMAFTGPLMFFQLILSIFAYFLFPESAPSMVEPDAEGDFLYWLWTAVQMLMLKMMQPYAFFMFELISLGEANYTDFDIRFMRPEIAASTLMFYLYCFPLFFVSAWAIFLFTSPLYALLFTYRVYEYLFMF